MNKELLKEVIKIISTHKDTEELSYCDTGSDMDFWCRSQCLEMAIKRLQDYYNK